MFKQTSHTSNEYTMTGMRRDIQEWWDNYRRQLEHSRPYTNMPQQVSMHFLPPSPLLIGECFFYESDLRC